MAKKNKAKPSNGKPAKKAGKKKYRGVEIDPYSQKILMLAKDGNWYEWSRSQLGRKLSQPPESHVGFVVIEDAEVTQPKYVEEYLRFIRLQWTGTLDEFE